MNSYSVILCGGTGSRLWPLSNKSKPKQFVDIINGVSLLDSTYSRFPDDTVVLVSNIRHKKQLDKYNCHKIYEPINRDTTAAILSAVLYIKSISQTDNPFIKVFPSDHLIDTDLLKEKTVIASGYKDSIVTMGVKPEYPETGYGYIVEGDNNSIQKFVEKPNLENAEKFYKDGSYLWNAGIFMFYLNTIEGEYIKYEKLLYDQCTTILSVSSVNNNTLILDSSYKDAVSNSFDYSIMEKTEKGKVVRFDGKWNDIGGWKKVHMIKESDENNNVVSCHDKIKMIDCTNCYIYSDDADIGVVGMDNVAVVKKGNSILVTCLDSDNSVKNIAKYFDKT